MMEKAYCSVDEIRAISFFSTSLHLKENIDEVLWDITKNVIHQLGFEDCVIYTVENNGKLLVQRAAYGLKNPKETTIYNKLKLQLGEGIVGNVALTSRAEIVNDTSKDPRYIIDDAKRLSEICVPILVNGHLFGIIDAEHHKRGFFTEKHLYLLTIIASLCAQKITEIKKRYRKPFSRSNPYYKKLEALMRLKKIYRDPYLSLTATADILGISACYLSSMINSLLKKSFIDFINEYRIADVKQNLKSEVFSHYTIVSVGLEAGFNSKSAFYTAFKKHTGLTPLAYKNREGVLS
jgi:AraC-like DNA-binding protein/putative methionine-R-sulfoxide reductase with GAF domain